MYMLSNSSKYAINAVLYIAVNASENQKIGVKEVADAIQIPSPVSCQTVTNFGEEKRYNLYKRTWRRLFPY